MHQSYTAADLDALRIKIQRAARELGRPVGAHTAHIKAVRLLENE